MRTSHRFALIAALSAALVIVGAGLGCKKDAELPTPQAQEKATQDKAPPAEKTAPAEKTPPAEAARDAPAPSAAEATVDRAIEAAGGLTALREACAAMSVKSRGTFGGMPYEMATFWQAPDRLVMAFEDGAMTMGYVGDACWNHAHDVVLDCTPDEAKSAKQTQWVVHLTNLYPLKEPGVTLEDAGAKELDGRKLAGVRATKAGAPVETVEFWFDSEDGLLRRVAWDGAMGPSAGRFESVIEAYAAAGPDGALKVPSKSKMLIDGRLLMDETASAPEFGPVDAARFERPPMGPVGQVKIRQVPAAKAAFRTVSGPYDGLGAAVGALYGWIGSHGGMPLGAPSFVYLKGPGDEEDPNAYVTELRVPVYWFGAEAPADADVTVRDVPAHEVAVAIHRGPYDRVGPVYGAIMAWVGQNGYAPAGPFGMTGFSDPTSTPPDELVSELWVPVTRR